MADFILATSMLLVATGLFVSVPFVVIPILDWNTKFKEANNLYKCSSRNCERFFRKYQIDLIESATSKIACPHCGNPGRTFTGLDSMKVDYNDSWMGVHQDCSKLSKSDFRNVMKAMESAKIAKEEREEIERFESYNNLQTDEHWIKKLQKELDKL